MHRLDLRQAANDLLTGLREHYPLCCVLNYCLDRLLGVPSGISRGGINDPVVGEYVPCHFHRRVKYPVLRSDWLRIVDGLAPCVEHLAPNDTVCLMVNARIVYRATIPRNHDALLHYTIWVL